MGIETTRLLREYGVAPGREAPNPLSQVAEVCGMCASGEADGCDSCHKGLSPKRSFVDHLGVAYYGRLPSASQRDWLHLMAVAVIRFLKETE